MIKTSTAQREHLRVCVSASRRQHVLFVFLFLGIHAHGERDEHSHYLMTNFL